MATIQLKTKRATRNAQRATRNAQRATRQISFMEQVCSF